MNREKSPTAVGVISSSFKVNNQEPREQSPGHVNKKGRHEWEILGKKIPKKTEEEIEK